MCLQRYYFQYNLLIITYYFIVFGSHIFRDSDFSLQIIKWFNDSWSPFSPLSLHRLVQMSDRKPGEWCGPASVCSAILRVMAKGSSLDSRLSQVQVYLARDRVIYREVVTNYLMSF